MAFCSQCGERLELQSTFCNACGARVAMPAAAQQTVTPGVSGNATPALAVRPLGQTKVRDRLIRGTAVAILVAAGAYLYATPYIALAQMKASAERLAFSELGESLDRESLKKSLKDALKTAAELAKTDEAEAGVARSGQSFADLAPLMGIGTDQLLEKLFEPSTLSELESAAKAGGGMVGELVPPSEKAKAEKLLAEVKDQISVSTGYTGLNTFEAVASNKHFGEVRLRFGRHGLVGWRLSEIDGGGAVLALMRRTGMATDEDGLTDAAMKHKRWYIARKWAKVSAEQGNALGHFRYGMLLLDGVEPTERNVDEALRQLKAAADIGHTESAALIARLYESGTTGKVDFAEAIKWYEKAFELQPCERYAANVAMLHLSDSKPSMETYGRALEWTKKAMDPALYVNGQAATNPKVHRKLGPAMHHRLHFALQSRVNGQTPSANALFERNDDYPISADGLGPFAIGMTSSELNSVLRAMPFGFETPAPGIERNILTALTQVVTLDSMDRGDGQRHLSLIVLFDRSRNANGSRALASSATVKLVEEVFANADTGRFSRNPTCPLASGDVISSVDEYGSWGGSMETKGRGRLSFHRCVNGGRVVGATIHLR